MRCHAATTTTRGALPVEESCGEFTPFQDIDPRKSSPDFHPPRQLCTEKVTGEKVAVWLTAKGF
jgi:hypothetical protein